MPRPRLPFVRHRTVNQLRAKYRACRHPVEKPRWHALWLLAWADTPRTPAQVADVVGLSAGTVREVPAEASSPSNRQAAAVSGR